MYEHHINEALREVKNGQHLRFINILFRTKEVCLAALKYETSHNSHPYDIHSVPLGNLDYIMEKLRQELKNNPYCLKYLEKVYLESIPKLQSMYWGFENYQCALKHYKAIDFDDMCRIGFYIKPLIIKYKTFILFNQVNLIDDIKLSILCLYIKLIA